MLYGLFAQFIIFSNLKSFGVNYLASSLEMSHSSDNNSYWLNSIWKRQNRPDYLKTKKPNFANKVSMKWKEGI